MQLVVENPQLWAMDMVGCAIDYTIDCARLMLAHERYVLRESECFAVTTSRLVGTVGAVCEESVPDAPSQSVSQLDPRSLKPAIYYGTLDRIPDPSRTHRGAWFV